MMADFETKQFDTRNALKATLKQNDTPVDLTDCDVFFKMYQNSEEIINREIIIDDAVNGVVWVVFNEDELEPGLHKGEFVVEWPDGKKETFPNDGYLEIIIRENLGRK